MSSAEIALLIAFIAFVLVTVRIMLHPRREIEEYAHIPLDNTAERPDAEQRASEPRTRTSQGDGRE